MPLRKPSARKTKICKEVKEVLEPEIKQARFSTIVEETISTNPDDFMDAGRGLEYIYFGFDTESETDSETESETFFFEILYFVIRPMVSNLEKHHILNYWFNSLLK